MIIFAIYRIQVVVSSTQHGLVERVGISKGFQERRVFNLLKLPSARNN